MILVTGGTGLVGSHLLYKLITNKEKVRALYRNADTLKVVKQVFSFYTDAADKLFNTIEWCKADINNIPSLNEAFRDVTYVYHCAALVSFDENDYGKLRKINIEGTANVVNLCLANHVQKLCYVSSIATLDESRDNELITESEYWNPDAYNSSYAITKYGAEMEVWRGAQEGLPVVIVNPGLILGAGFRDNSSTKIFTAVKNGLNYYTAGVIGCVAVEDVAEAMIKLMKSAMVNERYILVAENLSYKELLTLIAENIGVKPPAKAAKPWMLKILWRLDWLKNKLTGRQRSLTKHTVRSVLKINRYSNERIKKDLNFEFTPLSDYVKRIGSCFNA